MSFLGSITFRGSPRCSEPRWCPHHTSAQSPDLTLPHLSSSLPTDPWSSSWLSCHRFPALLVCKIITSASSRRRLFLTLKPSQVSVHDVSTHVKPERRDSNYCTSAKLQNYVMFIFSGMDLSKQSPYIQGTGGKNPPAAFVCKHPPVFLQKRLA